MEVPEANIARIADFHRVWERHKATDHAVEEDVGKLDIDGTVDLQRQGFRAFFSLLLELQGVESPVRGVANDHLVAHMMLEGHGVNPTAG